MRTAVVVFPGSNCDRDLAVALELATGQPPLMIWHGERTIPDVDFIGLPGGFSYGDYLRSGAMAARSPVMRAVIDHAERGRLVLGICNGFQQLTECGLLPGALMRNRDLKFICKDVDLRVENTGSPMLGGLSKGDCVRYPVAHHDGNYFADEATLDELESADRVAFRYLANPNGSQRDIAGITNAGGNVLGMMPHPERLIDDDLGGTDGAAFFGSILEAIA